MKLSKETKRWDRSSRCPHCRKFIWYTRDFVDGVEHSSLRLRPLKDPAAIQQCPRCDGRWFAYDRSGLVDVVEGERDSELVSSREIVMDNSKGTTSMVRTKTITEEWSRTYELTLEEGAVRETSITLGKSGVAGVSAMAQNALKTTYSIGQESRRSYSEEIPFDVPPGVRQVVTLTFRRIWQHGTLRVVDSNGEPEDVPYKVVVDLDMDMARVDA